MRKRAVVGGLKKMKKLTVLSLIILLGVFLVACSDNLNNTVYESKSSSQSEIVEVTTVEATEVTTFPKHPKLIDVTGMTKDTATTALENRGLKVKVVEEYSDTVKKDCIIDQIPKVENGITLNQGDEVTITVSLGKDKDKFYLSQMLYSDEKTDTKRNSFSIYDGEDYNNDKCKNALKFSFTNSIHDYSEEVQKEKYSTYSVSYDLDSKYTKFIAGLTHGGIDDEMKVEILGDDKLLFSQGITCESALFDVDLDVKDVKILTIKIGGFIHNIGNESELIFNNAYFS